MLPPYGERLADIENMIHYLSHNKNKINRTRMRWTKQWYGDWILETLDKLLYQKILDITDQGRRIYWSIYHQVYKGECQYCGRIFQGELGLQAHLAWKNDPHIHKAERK